MVKKDLTSLLKKLPHQPGVYKFKDEAGRILYVGKAKDLRKRVQSYFRKEKGRPLRTEKLIEKTVDVEWIVVGSDLEALFLETNLIKELKPKYNVLMKDDKNFVYIKITKNEDYPRIKIVRKVEKDGARYFGPKTAAHKVKKTLLLLQKIFMYRSCDLGIDWKDGKVDITRKTIAYPCLDYHIKRCAAPCIAKISPEEYGESMLQIERFLEGKTSEIESYLQQEMAAAAAEKKFEKAAQIRDKWLTIQDLKEKTLVTSPDHDEMDVFAFVLDAGKAYFNLFAVRDGRLINQENFVVDAPGFDHGDEPAAPEVMEAFLFQYYERAADIPPNILIPIEINEREFFEDWLKQQRNGALNVLVPQRGKKHQWIQLAQKNASSFQKQHKARWAGFESEDESALEDLGEILKLPKAPKRIEGYDISHLGGTDTVASMVVFENGVPKKSDYRSFRLKSIAEGEIDDFKSMAEILKRRLSYLKTGYKGLSIRQASKSLSKDLKLLFEEADRQWEGNLDHLLVAREDKKLLGALKVDPGKNGSFLVQFLYVNKAHRKKGVASTLLKTAIEKYKMKRLYVACLESLRDFYYDFGFEEVATFPKEFLKQVPSSGRVLYAYDPSKHKDTSFNTRPHLILIDGGKGQLSAALKARDALGLDIPMIGLAKQFEEIFLPGMKHALLLPKEAKANLLLQRVRNEAHRFAIGFQKKSRKKHLTASSLDAIKGLGKAGKMKLLNFFGSVAQLEQASESEIATVLGPSLAKKVWTHFQS